MFMRFTVTQGTMVDSMARVQSVGDKAVFFFVGDADVHHSEWLESVSATDRHGSDDLEFCNVRLRAVGARSNTHCF